MTKKSMPSPWTYSQAGFKGSSKLVSLRGKNNNAMSGKGPAPKTPPFAAAAKPPVSKGKKKGK